MFNKEAVIALVIKHFPDATYTEECGLILFEFQESKDIDDKLVEFLDNDLDFMIDSTKNKINLVFKMED